MANSSFLLVPYDDLTIDEAYLICKLKFTYQSTIEKQSEGILLKLSFFANHDNLKKKIEGIPLHVIPVISEFTPEDIKTIVKLQAKFPTLLNPIKEKKEENQPPLKKRKYNPPTKKNGGDSEGKSD